jgi:hypothetical protein
MRRAEVVAAIKEGSPRTGINASGLLTPNEGEQKSQNPLEAATCPSFLLRPRVRANLAPAAHEGGSEDAFLEWAWPIASEVLLRRQPYGRGDLLHIALNCDKGRRRQTAYRPGLTKSQHGECPTAISERNSGAYSGFTAREAVDITFYRPG